jgi:hypothetical protein
VSSDHGWVSYGPGDNAHLTDEVRAEMERRRRERRERQGALLAIVEVRVYEHEAEAGVMFPPEGLLGVETEQSVIQEVVRRAHEQLTQWR